MKEVMTRELIRATVPMPGSKSLAHRALIAAGLAKGKSRIRNFPECRDTMLTADALKELGVRISAENGDLAVSGTGGEFATVPERKEIFLGNSGTSYRLLLSIFALAQGEFLLKGTPRMHERPIRPLVRSLKRLGVQASCTGGGEYPPVLVRGCGIRGGRVKIAAGQSSQYVSSLLMAGPLARRDMEISVEGEPVSRPYLDMTVRVMEQFGIQVRRDGYGYFKVPSGQEYRSRHYHIEGDMSGASYFWAAAAVTGGSVTTTNINSRATCQGDAGFLDILEKLGCTIERGTDRVTVRGGKLRGVEADMGSMPDMVPTLAAIAPFAQGKTIIRNASHLRYKESDRLQCMALELGKLGVRVRQLPDGLVIHGGNALTGALVDPHDDHRIAMSLAVAGLRVPGVRIMREDCVGKSFPSFWDLWDGM